MNTEFDVIIIGGGPSGAICGTMLARSGHLVLLLEQEKFPRFHIGESLTTYATDAFKTLGVYEELDEINYVKKRGLEFVLPDKSKKIFFAERWRHDPNTIPWIFQMPRAKLDNVLLRNAERNGVTVREQHRVKEVLFVEDKAVGVSYRDLNPVTGNGELQHAYAPWTIDCSGQSGVLNKQLQNNVFDDILLDDKIAIYSHWQGNINIVNDENELNFKLCVHPNLRDWCWYIPLDKNLVSLGVVIDRYSVKNRQQDLESLFYEYAREIPFISSFLNNSTLERVEKFRGIKDFSYRSRQYYGKGWALAGDSAGFLDPIFSTGLQISFSTSFKLVELLDEMLKRKKMDYEALEAYETAVDRVYRLNSVLVYRFYACGIDFEKMESAKYTLINTKWASLGHLWRFLRIGIKVIAHPKTQRRSWAREVLFGDVKAGNLVAELFLVLADNYEALNKEALDKAATRTNFLDG